MSALGIRDWIQYDDKNYMIDISNNVYELTPVGAALTKEILEAVSESNNDVEAVIYTKDNKEDTKETCVKAGKRWAPDDVDSLRQMFAHGNTISHISAVLERNTGGVFSQLQKLELVSIKDRLETFVNTNVSKPVGPKVEKTVDKPLEKKLGQLIGKQMEAFHTFLSGRSFCLTGPGGTGKSYIIKHIQEHCKTNNIPCAITALTGVASSLIGGQTLHKWSGLGLMDKRIDTMVAIIKKSPAALARWESIKVLVIDEVSMMNQDMFELLNVVACRVRNNKSFYGGIQMIFCCDFAQLAPINGNYCFESPLWQKELANHTIYLNHILRQDCPEFVKMLGEIRLGIVSEESKRALNSRLNKKSDGPITPTMLYPHRRTVEDTNIKRLDELKSVKKLFTSKDSKYEFSSKLTVNAIAKDTETLEERCPKKITLCEGAQVMLTVNMDTEKGLVNGSRGVIVGFTGSNPDVLFDNGHRLTISPTTFECQTQSSIVRRVQIPLVLAWATTIHKCQGSTLTHAITDLRDIFCSAQGYVTLSRLKSLDGLYLTGIDYSKIKCEPRVKLYYECLSNNKPYTATKDTIYTVNQIDPVFSGYMMEDSD
jgi:ATP-dependent DNA helicase PIF1